MTAKRLSIIKCILWVLLIPQVLASAPEPPFSPLRHGLHAPKVFNSSPSNGATVVYTNPELVASVSDQDKDLMTVLFSTNASGTWKNIGTYGDVKDGKYSVVPTGMSKLSFKYFWSVSVTDGRYWTNRTYSFTTTNTILQRKWTVTGLPRTEVGVLVADVTGNKLEEIIYSGVGKVSVFNGTDGSLIWSATDSSIKDLAQPQIADLNQDGILEVAVPLQKPAGLLVLHANDGSKYWRRTGLGLETYSSPVIFDIDGTGYPTVFFASTDIYQGLDGTGRVTSLSYDGNILHQTFAWRPCAGGLSIADTDGDGEFELYMGDRNTGYGKGTISFWAKNLTRRWNREEIMGSSNIPMLADVNKDGTLDVVVGDVNGGLAVFRAKDGTTMNMTLNIPNDAPVHYQPSVYDVDQDGNLEMIMADGSHNATSNDIVVWDLVRWKIDARMYVGKNFYGPQVADVTGDGIMEIIAASYNGIHIFNKNYALIAQATGFTGTLNYAVVQDIDGDGYSEIIITSSSGIIYAFDTPARTPTPRPRTEVQFYSEYRRGAAEYVPPPGPQRPVIAQPYPTNGMLDVPVSMSKLSFYLKDYQGDPMNYAVTTNPPIGSGTGVNTKNGKYEVSIGNLAYSATYTWKVSVTDGKYWTNRTFTFTTESNVPWWNANWQYRKPIRFDHTKVASDLTNFPVLIDLTDNDLKNKTKTDGNDIVFTDANSVKLDHEIESYSSSTGRLVAWVKIPQLSSKTDTKIFMYYGNPLASSQQNPSGVWDSGFITVQHLEETGQIRFDSTSNGNHATAYEGVSKTTAGKIDGADQFDGINDYLSTANNPSLNPAGKIQIELWINLSPTGNYINLVSKGTYAQYYLRLGPNEGETYWYVKFSDGTAKSVEAQIGWTWNTWHYIVVTIDTEAQTTKVFLDGVEKLSSTFTSGKNIIATTNPLTIGAANQRQLKGAVDEIRISETARALAWIQTSYANQKNAATFQTVADEESFG